MSSPRSGGRDLNENIQTYNRYRWEHGKTFGGDAQYGSVGPGTLAAFSGPILRNRNCCPLELSSEGSEPTYAF